MKKLGKRITNYLKSVEAIDEHIDRLKNLDFFQKKFKKVIMEYQSLKEKIISSKQYHRAFKRYQKKLETKFKENEILHDASFLENAINNEQYSLATKVLQKLLKWFSLETLFKLLDEKYRYKFDEITEHYLGQDSKNIASDVLEELFNLL